MSDVNIAYSDGYEEGFSEGREDTKEAVIKILDQAEKDYCIGLGCIKERVEAL